VQSFIINNIDLIGREKERDITLRFRRKKSCFRDCACIVYNPCVATGLELQTASNLAFSLLFGGGGSLLSGGLTTTGDLLGELS
jgi:hypothetical protein